MNINNLYLKYLIRAHTIIGVFVVFIFFISSYFGTITLFKPYINDWENPSRHFGLVDYSKFDIDESVSNALKELKNPTNNVQIVLPSFKDKALSVNYGFSEKVYINPNTNEVLDTKMDTNLITTFFNQMHINLNIPKFGQITLGLVSIAIIFLTISGIYLWLINKNNRSNIKSFWFKWHKNLSLIILPYILIFSLSGAVLGLMLLGSAPFALSATDGKEKDMSKLVKPAIFSKNCRVKQSGQKAPMKNISELYDNAKQLYPNLNITKIVLNAWGDKNACISFNGYLKDNRALSGRANRASISFKGVDGKLLKKKGLNESHSMAKVLSRLYFLHFLTDEKLGVRILFFISGIVFITSMIFGMFIWLEKRASKFKEDKKYFSFISRVSLALFIGVVPASSFLLFLYWILPFYTNEKQTWVIGGFYCLWSFTLFYSIYKQSAIDIIKFFLKLNFVFLILAVLFHGIRSGYFLWDSFTNNMFEIFWIDLSLLLFAFISFFLAKYMPNIKLIQRI